MSQFDFDLLVIGAGSAGVRAARMAGGKGKRVAIVESRYLGGTCVNVGCVPKKLFVYASEIAHSCHEGKGYGLDLNLNKFDWASLRDNKTKEIERLNGIYQKLLDNSQVTTLWGHGKLIGPHEVDVDGKQYSSEKILLATGGWPNTPDIPGADAFINSNDFFYMESFPKKALVVGSGYIAVEFAGILNGLGCDTTISSRSGKLLRGFDETTRAFAQTEILKSGIHLISGAPLSIHSENNQHRVSFKEASDQVFDVVINASGRIPNLDNLGVNELGIALNENGTVAVSKEYATNIPSIFAMGDLIDTPQLTPVALAEAMTFLAQQYDGKSESLNYSDIPTAVFSQPNLATVGLTEEQALETYADILVFESDFKALKHTLSGLDQRTYMKLIVDKKSDRVVGAHMVGEHAGEILQGIAIAIKAGASKKDFDSTIGIHPSSAEEFVTMRTASNRD